MKGNVWESRYLDAYDKILLNCDIYLAVRNFHVSAMHGCKTVLDSGSGTGNVTIELLRSGAEVYAVDPSKKANDILKRKCSEFADRLHVHEASAEGLSFLDKNTFNGITSMFVIYYMDGWESYLRENYKVLKPGGIIAITGRGTTENRERVLESYRRSLIRKGLMEGLKEEWEIFSEKWLGSVMPSVSIRPKEEIMKTMSDIGFRNIEEHQNPYFGQCYSLTAHKPE
jgi:ubiquinone/menaquinone biosynthesis C-methylase UbiE